MTPAEPGSRRERPGSGLVLKSVVSGVVKNLGSSEMRQLRCEGASDT